MIDIAKNLQQVQQRIHQATQAAGRKRNNITLLAVSKTKPVEMIEQAYAAGQTSFGENYLQDALAKISALRNLDISWHYIGRIQSNKCKDIAQHFAWVHGLDKAKHAERLSHYRAGQNTFLQCCIQVNLSGEANKGGIAPDELPGLAHFIQKQPRLKLRGLMTMPNPQTSPEEQSTVFQRLAILRKQLNDEGLTLDTLSMGMSGDLEMAIAAGSTMVRIGTDIFGERGKGLTV
jgi:pyridoxal phosphate enzyme (YggS family)